MCAKTKSTLLPKRLAGRGHERLLPTDVAVFLQRIVSGLTSICRYWKMVSFYNLSDADTHRAIPVTVRYRAMGFTAIAKVIDFGGLSPAQKRKLKNVLVAREKKLKAAIRDVEAALDKLRQKPRKSKKKTAKGKR